MIGSTTTSSRNVFYINSYRREFYYCAMLNPIYGLSFVNLFSVPWDIGAQRGDSSSPNDKILVGYHTIFDRLDNPPA